ncbi:retrovirus-related pol polyprotein from transposon TNT 1-94 [Tanacetum coccineum]
MTKQENESMLYDKFDKFTPELGESVHSYYPRFAKLINDMNMIPMSMTLMQINTKFVNYLHPEWSRFVTPAKQARNLHSVAFDQLYAFLKHNERDAKEVREMSTDSRHHLFAGQYYNPTSCHLRFKNTVFNAVGNTGENQPRVIICYNCKGEGHMAKQCTAKKRVKDSEWFKDKMLLAQAQEAGVVLNDEQQDFLADSWMKLMTVRSHYRAITNLQGRPLLMHIDSDCDEKLQQMANLHGKFLKGKFSESQTNHRGTSVNTKLSKPSTSGTKLYSVTQFPKSKVIPKVVKKNVLSKSVTSHLTTNKIIEKCTKVLALGLLKIETEPINAYIKNNKVMHRDYLRVTKEHVATLQKLLEQARALKPLDKHIGYASKFAAQIQELLVYVSALCPFTQSGNEKWASATSNRKNNKPFIDASRTKQTIKTITKEHTVKQNTRKTNNTMLPSTGRVSFTNARGS